MKPTSLKFLGRCELAADAGDGPVLVNAKTALLLARLAMPPAQSYDRKRLIELIWPDRAEVQALASLRQSLWILRRDLGAQAAQPVVTDRSSVRLDPAAVEVDTVVFENLIRSGMTDAFERAVDLYRGDYLAEVDLDADDSHAPFVFERQRLRGLYLSCLKALIGQRAAAGQTDRAVGAAQKALTLDPLQEDVHAALIRLHLDRGHLGAARAQYEMCRETLRRELGIAPSAEIEALRDAFGSIAGPRKTRAVAPQLAASTIERLATPDTPGRYRFKLGFLAPGVVAIATLALIGFLFLSQRSDLPLHAAAADARPSLVVLPFQDASPNAAQTDYAAGLSDNLITDLAKVSGLFVIAAETSRVIADPGIPAEKQAAGLGVAYAVRGVVHQTQGKMGATIDLIRAGTGEVIWSRYYDRQGADLFVVQDDIVRGIAAALGVRLSDRELRTVSRIPTNNLEARDFFLRAEYQTIGLEEADSFRRSLANYQRAFEIDPNFAEAYAGYARIAVTVWRRDFSEIMSGAVAKHEAYDAAGKAIQLDPENARAYEVLSIIQAVEGEHQIAVESARQAVDLQPGDAEARANLATVLYFAGDLDGAMAEVNIARSLNPALSTDLRLTSAMVSFAQHHYPIAIEQLNAILESVPRSDLVLEHLAAAYAYLGDLAKAKALVAELKGLVPITNLGFYSVLSKNIGTTEQTAYFIEGLRRAGIPEWPFGDQRRLADRMSAAELQSVVAGPVWKGELTNGVGFVQYFDKDGSFAYASTASLLTGRVEIHGDELCQVIDGYLLNRPSCGYVYRNVPAPGRPDEPLAYVSVDAVKYFSVTQ